MGAASAGRFSPGRYRRRILGWGAVGVLVILAVGSVVTLARVEDDLRSRVTAAFDDAGIDGVTVSFSGQDGTVRCVAPLADPEAARRIGGELRGVRNLDLGPGCVADGALASDEPEPPPTATTGAPSSTAPPTSAGTTTTVPDPTTVLDIVFDDPQFSVLKNALETVDLGDELDGADGLTIFAPTDDAFAALGPNFNAALASDPQALASVLRHHIVLSDLPSDDLDDGELVMLDGTAVEIDTSPGVRVTSGEVTGTVVDADLDAVNGTVHAIDQVLLPEGLDLGVVADVFTFIARYENGQMTLSGRVADNGQRQLLVALPRTYLDEDHVVDQLVIDPEAPITDADVEALAELVLLVVRDLVVGEMVLTQDGIFVSGIAVDPTSIEEAAERFGASVALTPRPAASDAGAAEVEQRLNEAVAADPIRFEPASAELTSDRAALDRLAAVAKSLDGLVITVEGYTDSDGSILANLELSQARAEAVVSALAGRGVPRADLAAVGRGSAAPIFVDGVEDKAASRRVEFVVERE